MKKILVLFVFLIAGFVNTANAFFVYEAAGRRHMMYLGNNTYYIWCTEPWNEHCFTIIIDDDGQGSLFYSPSGNGIDIGDDFDLVQDNNGASLTYTDHGN